METMTAMKVEAPFFGEGTARIITSDVSKALAVCAAIGVWLMFTRLIFGTSGAVADSDHLTGSLVFTFSVAAFAEVARPLQAINMLFGAWLIAALLILLSLPRGPIRHHYAGWDRFLIW